MVEKYTDVPPANSDHNAVLDYYHAVEVLDADNVTQAEKREALQTLTRLWDSGFSMAAHHLGRAWRDGLGILPDDEEAEFWFRQASEAGGARSQYALGMLLQEQRRVEEAMVWYMQAADARNQTVRYHLGKLFLQGEYA